MALETKLRTQFRNEYHKATLNIFYVHSWLWLHHSQVFKKHNLTIQQFNILRILRGQNPDPTTMGMIKERMIEKQSDASRVVENLAKKKLVNRYNCPEDRRIVHVYITQEGLDMLEALDKESDSFDSLLKDKLDYEDVAKLNEILDKLNEQIDEE